MPERTENAEQVIEPRPNLYIDIPAYTPESLGYRFKVVYQDPDFHDPSLEVLVSRFNQLPTLGIAQTEPDQKTEHKSHDVLTVVSPAHNRSTMANKIGDLHLQTGDPTYQALSLKGNAVPENLKNVDLRFDPATGVRITGLWMGSNKASFYINYADKCRSIAAAGIPSERIVVIFQATHVPFTSSTPEASLENRDHEFNYNLRQVLIDHFLGNQQTVSKMKAQQAKSWGGDTTMLKYRIETLLKTGEIAIIVRAMQVNERIRDISSATKPELEKLTLSARKFVSAQDPENYQFLPVSTDLGVDDFLQKWLPLQMGYHLGSWHRKGFVHGYAHDQNWTLAGTLIDIDSARQSTDFNLNDTDQLQQYQGMRLYDLLRSFTSVDKIFGGLFKEIPVPQRDHFLQIRDQALVSFLTEYSKVMFPQFDTLAQKIEALTAFVTQQLPNPHFDAARDVDALKTVSLPKPRSEYDPDLWGRTLSTLRSAS